MPNSSLGAMLRSSREAYGLSLNEVAKRAGCSPAYVHKLEMDSVRTPSPRVLARLGEALGLSYGNLMGAAGYERLASGPETPRLAGAVKRYSNAHIVELLEQLQGEIRELKSMLAASSAHS